MLELYSIYESNFKVKNLYESFVSARDREERGLTEKTKNSDRPRTGNTVHVFGYNITEDIIRLEYIRERHSLDAQTRLMIALVCRGAFVPPPGCKIINVSMEVEKNTGFVTFDKPEAAEAAINQHNGQLLYRVLSQPNPTVRPPGHPVAWGFPPDG